LLAGVAEERQGLLVDDRARLRGRGADFDQAVHLVAALVVLEGERGAVLAPRRLRDVVRVEEERVVDNLRTVRLDVEDVWTLDVEDVAGLRVLHHRVLRLELILGRRLDVVDEATVAGRDFVDGDLRRVGGPDERGRVVVAALGPVGTEDLRLARARGADRNVVVVDEGFKLAVGRFLRLGAVDVERRAHGAGQAAAHAAAASRASALGRRRARVGLERALPRRRPLE